MVTRYLGQTPTVPTLPLVSTIRVQQLPYIVYPRVLQCISVPKFSVVLKLSYSATKRKSNPAFQSCESGSSEKQTRTASASSR